MTLSFPGGDYEPRTPKPDELLLSARQWVTRAKEELQDSGSSAVAIVALDRALAALAELKGHV